MPILTLVPMPRVRSDTPRPNHHRSFYSGDFFRAHGLVPFFPQESQRVLDGCAQAGGVVERRGTHLLCVFEEVLRSLDVLPGCVGILAVGSESV